MLGFGLKSKALAVLRDHYAYAPGAFQMGILNQIVGNAKSAGANEYDVSIMFMLVQMNVLTPGEKDTRMFVLQHAQNIVKALPHAKGELADVHSLLEEILRNHQISLRQDEFLLFDDWYQSFKIGCGGHNAMLKPDEDGASIIDFMEKEPLHRAHQDGVDPFTLAEQFAPTFHPDTFGR